MIAAPVVIVGTAVVDGDNLEIRKRLPRQTSQGALQKWRRVVARYDDANRGVLHSGHVVLIENGGGRGAE